MPRAMYHHNNIQKRLELNQKKADAGLVSERFPKVSGMEIRMTYYQRPTHSDSDILLMVRTVNVFPGSFAYFHMPCTLKECDGGFDLSPAISEMVKGGKKKSRGKLDCKGKGKDVPAVHASVDYEITVRYGKPRPLSVPPPPAAPEKPARARAKAAYRAQPAKSARAAGKR